MGNNRFCKEKIKLLEFIDGEFEVKSELWAVKDTKNKIYCEVVEEHVADILCELLNSLPEELLLENWG